MEGIVSGTLAVRLLPKREGDWVRKMRVFLGQNPAVPLEFSSSAIVTRDWDLLHQDAIINTGQFIQVGTGLLTAARRVVGARPLDRGYPVFIWNHAGLEQDVITYRGTFQPGSMNVPGDGGMIREVCIWPDAAEDFYLAHGRLTEAMPVRAGDTLTVTMELICVRPKVREGESYKWLVNT